MHWTWRNEIKFSILDKQFTHFQQIQYLIFARILEGRDKSSVTSHTVTTNSTLLHVHIEVTADYSRYLGEWFIQFARTKYEQIGVHCLSVSLK